MERVVFFINGTRGLAVLEKTLAAGHGIAAVFVPADSPPTPPLGRLAETTGLRIETVQSVNAPEFIDRLSNLRPSVSVIAGFSMIFKQEVISVPALGTINLHAGRLPEYRGGSPLNWQLINGENEAEISVIQVDPGIDTGDVLARCAFPIESSDTIAELHDKANTQFPNMVIDVLGKLDLGTLAPEPQDNDRAAY